MGGNVTSDHQRAVQACPDPELQRSVQVYGSQLQYVIIGDNNNLQAEYIPEEEEGEEEELINKSNWLDLCSAFPDAQCGLHCIGETPLIHHQLVSI